MKKHFLLLLTATLLLTISAAISLPSHAVNPQRAPAIFTPLETFDNLLSGNIHSQGAWVANEPGAAAGAIVDDTPPIYMAGKVLKNNPNGILNRGNVFLPLGSNTIGQTETATVFFQVALENLNHSDFSVGVTKTASPDIFNPGGLDQYAFDLRFNQNGLQIRNGDSYETVSNFTLQNNILYHVWLVIDNNADTFTVFIDDSTSPTPIQAATASGSLFFSREFADDPLRAFAIQNHGLNSSDSYLDNLYIDKAGQNLAQPAESFQTIDRFEGVNSGLLNGQNSWLVEGSATINDDPENSENQVAKIEGSDTTISRPLDAIPPSNLGTLHFRLYRNGTINSFSGLSDVAVPAEWEDFEAQFGTQSDSTGNFMVRNGEGFTQIGSLFKAEAWYCVWLVVDNNNDSYQAFVKGGDLDQITQLGTGDFNLRNGGNNPLTHFMSKSGPGSTSSYLLDDIYIDSQRRNLTIPGHDCEDQIVVDPDAPLIDPIPKPIYKDGAAVKFETIASLPSSTSGTLHPRTNPYTRLTFLSHAPDNSGRLFVNDLRGKMHLINPSNGSTSIYLDLKSQVSAWIESPGLNSGFSTFAFHPDFKNNGLFYTVHTENAQTSSKTADFGSINPQPKVSHNVLTEWTASNPASNSFSGPQREVLRVEQASFLHGMQHAAFNPLALPGDDDYGLLYISLGDGEQEPHFTETAQNRKTIQGTIIRIDPTGENSGNGKYGIPLSNPYVGSSLGHLPEIFAYGFRNPHRMAWDPLTKHMFVSGIGQNNIDELNIVQKGRNYGWNEREGSFRFSQNNPENVYPLPADDAQNNYTYPVAEYDHDEGFAISGGIPYRGSLMPELYDAYIFGDIVKGHLFYVKIDDLTFGGQTTIHKLTLLNESNQLIDFKALVDSSNQRADLRFGVDQDGEIYIFSRHDATVRRLVSARKAPGLDLISSISLSSTDGAYYYDVIPADMASNLKPFSDSSATILSLPTNFPSGNVELFVNRNSERSIPTSQHIGLIISQSADIYVAHDDRNSIPVWLNSWQKTDDKVTLSQSGQTVTHTLFKRTVQPGELILGGNSGISNANNYFVFAKKPTYLPPLSTPTPIPSLTQTIVRPTGTISSTLIPDKTPTASSTPNPFATPTATTGPTITITSDPPLSLPLKSYLPFASN
ncbi:MAG: sorbosone dehydrogenase family protein [Anaerolineae bacterium]